MGPCGRCVLLGTKRLRLAGHDHFEGRVETHRNALVDRRDRDRLGPVDLLAAVLGLVRVLARGSRVHLDALGHGRLDAGDDRLIPLGDPVAMAIERGIVGLTVADFLEFLVQIERETLGEPRELGINARRRSAWRFR